MSLTEAIATQPLWVQIWVNALFLGAFVLPLALLFWHQSRLVGLVTVAASLLAVGGILWLHAQMGYVRLLGLPHILFWTPTVVYLWRQSQRPDIRRHHS